jgi:CHASE3 domain sensor protein
MNRDVVLSDLQTAHELIGRVLDSIRDLNPGEQTLQRVRDVRHLLDRAANEVRAG